MSWRAVVLVAVLLLAGCGGNHQPAEGGIVDREALLQAFAGIGEPLALTIDFVEADPDAAVDAGFNPEREDVDEAPFTLTLFKRVDAAEEQAKAMEIFARRDVDFVQRKNVILILATSLPVERRQRLIDALESL